MATSFPQRPLFAGDPLHRSQHLVWQLAGSQLPDDVTLLPNVALRRRRLRSADTPALETTELVVVDPEHGVTLVVVGRLDGSAAPDGVTGDDLVAATLPTISARAGTLLAELGGLLSDGDPALGRVPLRWALALPGVEVDQAGLLVVPPEALWDHGAFVGAEALANAYHALWSLQPVGSGDGELPLTPRVVDRVHQRLVQRSAHGVSYLADRLRHDDERLQGVVPAGLLRTALGVSADGATLVTGASGTGKTAVGIEVAAAAAARGERVLVTTPHRALGTWLRQRLSDVLVADGLLQAAVRVGDDPRGRLVVGDVVGLSGASPGHGEDALRFFDAQAPDWVSPRRFSGRFDLVVVDEWHALGAGHRAALGAMVTSGGRLVALADPQQASRDDDLAADRFGTRLDLELDVRSTAALVAGRDAALSGDDPDPAWPDDVVTWVPAASGTLGGVARSVVDELVASGTASAGDVAVLRLSPGPRIVDPAGQDHLAATLRSGGAVEAPAISFAGLHRPSVVVVLDVEQVRSSTPGDALRRLAALAASRATERLVVVGDPAAIRLRGLGVLADRLAAATRAEPLGTA